ncbi:sodium:solute symporter family transporter, partial [Treponema sp. R6D11]
VESGHALSGASSFPVNYWNFLSSGKLDWKSWADILSGFGWGLGYFGMPHIIIRYMAIRSQKDVRKGAKIGITWNILILLFSVAAGCIGRMFLGGNIEADTVFIQMVRMIFPGVIAGILLSAILAAAMSTADSQLLASASAFAADVYKPVLRKGQAGDEEMFWAGRIVVAVIAIIAVIIASNPGSGTIMSLVGNAWGVFGAAFGPAILLSLFWKRFTFAGAVAGIVAGAVADVIWLTAFSGTGLYEIIPGFVIGLITAIVVTLCGKNPGAEVEALYDKSLAIED